MDKTQIIIFAAAMVFIAFRVYQKYIKKGKNLSGSDTKKSADTFPLSSKDEEYEPYSKK